VFGNDFPRPHIPMKKCIHDPKDFAVAKALCKDCASQVKVKLTSLDCPFPDPIVNKESKEWKDPLKGNDHWSGIVALQLWQDTFVRAHFDSRFTEARDSKDDIEDTEVRKDIEAHYGGVDHPLHQLPYGWKLKELIHIGLEPADKELISTNLLQVYESSELTMTEKVKMHATLMKFAYIKVRCDELKKKVKAKFGKMKSVMEKRACACLGCCDSIEPPDDDCFYPPVIEL
jgi:hypothetical protein